MKREGYLWQRLISFENLLAAAEKACKGKRFRSPVAAFHLELEHQLWRLHRELADKTYRPGAYRTFFIHEPKLRQISAAPYRDRVVHHALTRVLEPIFEKSFLHDSYACRKDKGTHAAVRRCQHYARRYRYVLKADIRAILKALLARKVKDSQVLWLCGLLIDGSNPQEEVCDWFAGDDLFAPPRRRRGLPIGNQTSQFFANVSLDPLDHFVKEQQRAGGYLRYVDDFLIFGNDRRRLVAVRSEIGAWLARLRLRLHPDKSVVFPVKQGIPFLGYRVFPTHRLLVKDNVHRFRRRLRSLQRRYARYEIDFAAAYRRIISWIGHARQADTYRLRERLFAEHPFRRASTQ